MHKTLSTDEIMNTLGGLTPAEFATLALACADEAGLSVQQSARLREQLADAVAVPLVE